MTGLPKGGYGIISRTAMRNDKISKEAKAVYALLCSYTGSKHYCYPTVATIAKDLGTSDRTIIRLTEELQSNGFVKKVKIPTNKRKTAYVPLVPTGQIGDMGDTISEIGDTDDTQIGDTHDTLILTNNNNSKKAGSSGIDDNMLIHPTFANVKNGSKKEKKSLDLSSIEQVLNILKKEDKNAEKAISYNLKRMIENALEKDGEEFVCDAVRGRIIQAKERSKPLALSTFFDPENAEWRAECAKRAEVKKPLEYGSTLPEYGKGEKWYAESR